MTWDFGNETNAMLLFHIERAPVCPHSALTGAGRFSDSESLQEIDDSYENDFQEKVRCTLTHAIT